MKFRDLFEALTVYRAGREQGQDGKTFYALDRKGAEPYAKGYEIKQHEIHPKNVFDATGNIEHFRMYNQFLKDTNHPAGRGKTGLPFWTAEPHLKKWLDSKGHSFDAVKYDENTGVPSIAVYHKGKQ